MKKDNKPTFFDLLKNIFRFDRFLLWFCLTGMAISIATTGSQYFWRQQERDYDRLAEFKQDASKNFDTLYQALNKVDNDLLAREDICLSAIPEKEKIDRVFDLKIKSYNEHRFLALNEVAVSRDFFGARIYEMMEKLMEDLNETEDEFRSCSPESLKMLSEEAWSQKKIALTWEIQRSLSVIRRLKTADELDKYEEKTHRN